MLNGASYLDIVHQEKERLAVIRSHNDACAQATVERFKEALNGHPNTLVERATSNYRASRPSAVIHLVSVPLTVRITEVYELLKGYGVILSMHLLHSKGQ